MFPRVTETKFCTITEVLWPMADGVELYTRIIKPTAEKKCPIVFIRTPYEAAPTEEPPKAKWEEFDEDDYMKAGYCLVRQHVRGRGGSGGHFRAYDEREDGLFSLNHIRNLSCYMGEIYLLGESYTAAAHLSWLDAAPEDVKGAALAVMSCRQYPRFYIGGCNYDYCNLSWWRLVYDREYPQSIPEDAFKRPFRFPRPFKDVMAHVQGENIPVLSEYLLHDKDDGHWHSYPQSYRPEGFRVPILFTGGWYDRFMSAMLQDWCRLPENTREKSAFLIGPWGHGLKLSGKATERTMPNGARPTGTGLLWFEHLRKDKPAPYKEGHLTVYNVGGGWETTLYPVPEKGSLRLNFLQEGILSADCAGSGSITYRYDPENVPVGLSNAPAGIGHEPGTLEGVTTFLSAPFPEEQRFCGRHRWRMTVASDCEDTMFFLRLYLVEDGKAWKLTDFTTTLSNICPNYTPGSKVTLELTSPLMAFTVKPGVCLRADISSFCAIYVPHANVRGPWAEVTETKVAHNTLYLEGAELELLTE